MECKLSTTEEVVKIKVKVILLTLLLFTTALAYICLVLMCV